MKLKTLALSELRLIAERTRLVKVPVPKVQGSLLSKAAEPSAKFFAEQSGRAERKVQSSKFNECIERIPWRVWYVAASNGDCIYGEECITLSVDVTGGPGAYPSRLVQFTASGQTRRLRDCCILRANDFILRI